MNIVIISGRLTGNPDIKVVSNNTKIARYILAVDRIYSKKTKRQILFTALHLERMQISQKNIYQKDQELLFEDIGRQAIIQINPVKNDIQMIVLLSPMNLKTSKKCNISKHKNPFQNQFRNQSQTSWMYRI